MNGFLDSIKPVLDRLFKQYKIEILLIFLAGALTLVGLFLFMFSSKESDSDKIVIEKKPSPVTSVYVAIEGAVVKPGVYTFSTPPRLKEVLEKAKGLSQEADKTYVSQELNLAQILSDQDKIYIPTQAEVAEGEVKQSVQTGTTISSDSSSSLININSATGAELDILPGIGKVTAQKIIEGRPYQSVEDLLTQKIVKSNVYEQIKELVTAD